MVLPHVFTREELLGISRTNPEALVDIVLALQDVVVAQQKRIEHLEARVQELEARLAKNSTNSHKPPSSDGYAKPAPKSLRSKSDRPNGGQPGHPGHTLEMAAHPDQVIIHPLTRCRGCGHDLTSRKALRHERRQVHDLPEVHLQVAEHQGEVKVCPGCGELQTAAFPPGVEAPVQYGPRFRSWLVYGKAQQLLPLERLQQMSYDLFGQRVSEFTIEQAVKDAAQALVPFETALIGGLLNSPHLHVDETGVRVAGKLHWQHVASTSEATWYGVHPHRGTEAIDDFGLLPNYSGRLIHDFWHAYLGYGGDHGLCNAHHRRELVFLYEQQHQRWGQKMEDLLLRMHQAVAEARAQGLTLTPRQQGAFRRHYRRILRYARPPASDRPIPRRGRKPKSKGQNLVDRLKTYEEWVLAFLQDPSIPFTNNQAERDLRMTKVQQKISGGFRTFAGAQCFARLRGYLSTMRKQGHNILDAITQALQNRPIMPNFVASASPG